MLSSKYFWNDPLMISSMGSGSTRLNVITNLIASSFELGVSSTSGIRWSTAQYTLGY